MTRDTYVGGLTALAGLLAVFVLVPYGVELYEIDDTTLVLIRPDFWPLVVGWLMVAVGAGFALWSMRHASADVDVIAPFGDKTDARGMWACVGVIAIFLFTSDATGMVLPAIALFLVASLGFGQGRLWLRVAGSVLVPLGIMLFFEHVANIPVPLGPLEGLF
ncbi:MAG: tripartite tricarboxylate transporter TctB family protein [Proteobacteria bacterium]|nr:tripartite tricarboxylate transporter TctB family protein [Pseudomonadota bacterium]